jgi:excisionase family DNA binding protein
MSTSTPDSERAAPLCISVEEAAAMLGIGRSKAYEAARAGRLPVVRWGRALRVVRAGIEEILRERIAAAAEKRAEEYTA